jgi:hypothetical protein
MRLSDYQWSRNPRGLHVASAFQTPMDYERYTRPMFGWVKLLAATTDYVDDAVRFQQMGITPIVRLYLGRWGAQPFNRQLQAIQDAFISVGVKWFEFYNEPNLDVEWVEGFAPDWRNTDGVIRPLMDNWLAWAEYTIQRGCYPGFIPLAESDTIDRASVLWMDAFLNYLAQNHYDRFVRVLNNGMYVATHPYILNHYYQQMPGGGALSARPPELQRGAEGGWHFEYPYDPISQANDPGRTVFGGTARTPNGDPVGLIAMGRMFNERAAQLFGTQAVPVVGTEGGIWGFRGQVYQQDTRYPPYNEVSQGEATLAMFNWIATQAPAWFFGLTLWKEDDYYTPGTAPAIDRLAEHRPLMREIPDTEVMGSGLVVPTPQIVPGPGVIHGEPNHHILLIAPGLNSDVFFEAAQPYWNSYRPIVTTMTELIDLIPSSQSLAITVLSPLALEGTLRSAIEDRYPNVYFDLIIADEVQAVRDVLNNRVRSGLRFG